MAEVCKDIDQGLAALNRKIDEQNKRLRELEQKQKECCNNNKDNNKNKNNSDLESRVSKLETYITALDGDIKNITKFIDEIWEHTEDILKTLQAFGEKLVSWIGSAVKLFGGF